MKTHPAELQMQRKFKFSEPWRIGFHDHGDGVSIIISGKIEIQPIRVSRPVTFKLGVGSRGITLKERDDIADRIIACVNACAGMGDPAAEIGKLRKAASPDGSKKGKWLSGVLKDSEKGEDQNE